MDNVGWDTLGTLSPEIVHGIFSYGFEAPSEIQQRAIPPLLLKRDVIAQAPSGTGKTGAFAVAALHAIDVSLSSPQVILLAPTHELVSQIFSVVEALGSKIPGGVRMKSLVGGTPVQDDLRSLKQTPPHLIVGTAGRVLDMLRRKAIAKQHLRLVILDEADEMLSGNFRDQMYHVFQCIPTECQVAVFSATLPSEVLDLTARFMRDPVTLTIEAPKLNLEGIQQYFVAVPDDRVKYDALKDLFAQLTINQSIIYVNSVQRVVTLYESMIQDGFSVCCIHSSMRREEREKAFYEFRTGTHRVLISSNVTARGIDVQQVSTVLNFDIPGDVHTYLHRIGRSGRWGRKGLAINFMTRRDVAMMRRIEEYYQSTIKELPQDVGALCNNGINI
jgi:superfamily II DNA/RNA helicase